MRASASRYAVQRLLIEMCSTRAFKNTISADKIAAIYGLFKAQQDCFFYLDAFYYALRHTTQKNCLKSLLMDDLERSTTAKNGWALASMSYGALYQRGTHIRCGGYKCASQRCKYCEIVSGVAIKDLLAALRYAQVSQ